MQFKYYLMNKSNHFNPFVTGVLMIGLLSIFYFFSLVASATETTSSGAGAMDPGTVNLSSGTVEFSRNLASVENRGGLGFTFTLNYSSAIQNDVDSWNLSNPTSSVGLGWSIPRHRIVRRTSDSVLIADSQFYLQTGSSMQELIPTGKQLSTGLQYAVKGQFSKAIISFDKKNNRWILVDSDGLVYIFGGPEPVRASSGTNRVEALKAEEAGPPGSSVEWGLHWKGWTGPSNAPIPQQYAVAWNLSIIRNAWGDQVSFQYLHEKESTNGSGPVVYTKAAYLQTVTGPVGDALIFKYSPKTAGEYADPHIEASEPDAYQERFETQYLSQIQILNPQGQLILQTNLDYQMIGQGQFTKRLLSGISQQSTMGLAIAPPERFSYWGESQDDGVSGLTTTQGNTISYSLFNKQNGAMYGALKSVTSPEGGTVTYRYESVSGDASNRTLTVKAPAEGFNTPRVYFGSDSALVTWTKIASITPDPKTAALIRSDAQMTVQMYDWKGTWVPAGSQTISVVDDTLVQVKHVGDYVIILAPVDQTPSQSTLYTFTKSESAVADWIWKNEGNLQVGWGADAEIFTEDRYFVISGKWSGFATPFVRKLDLWDSSFGNLMTAPVVKAGPPNPSCPSLAGQGNSRDNTVGTTTVGTWSSRLIVINTNCSTADIPGQTATLQSNWILYDVDIDGFNGWKGSVNQTGQNQLSAQYNLQTDMGQSIADSIFPATPPPPPGEGSFWDDVENSILPIQSIAANADYLFNKVLNAALTELILDMSVLDLEAVELETHPSSGVAIKQGIRITFTLEDLLNKVNSDLQTYINEQPDASSITVDLAETTETIVSAINGIFDSIAEGFLDTTNYQFQTWNYDPNAIQFSVAQTVSGTSQDLWDGAIPGPSYDGMRIEPNGGNFAFDQTSNNATGFSFTPYNGGNWGLDSSLASQQSAGSIAPGLIGINNNGQGTLYEFDPNTGNWKSNLQSNGGNLVYNDQMLGDAEQFLLVALIIIADVLQIVDMGTTGDLGKIITQAVESAFTPQNLLGIPSLDRNGALQAMTEILIAAGQASAPGNLDALYYTLGNMVYFRNSGGIWSPLFSFGEGLPPQYASYAPYIKQSSTQTGDGFVLYGMQNQGSTPTDQFLLQFVHNTESYVGAMIPMVNCAIQMVQDDFKLQDRLSVVQLMKNGVTMNLPAILEGQYAFQDPCSSMGENLKQDLGTVIQMLINYGSAPSPAQMADVEGLIFNLMIDVLGGDPTKDYSVPGMGQTASGNAFMTTNAIAGEDITSVTLYRLVDDDVQNSWQTWPVASAEVCDGYQCTETSYFYDSSLASFDSSGNTATFGKVQVTPGTDSSGKAVNGYRLHYFFNRNASHVPTNTIQVCTSTDSVTLTPAKLTRPQWNCTDQSTKDVTYAQGKEYLTEIYDGSGNLVSSTATQYQEFERPVVVEVGGTPIKTAWAWQILPASTVNMLDNVSTTAEYEYDGIGRQILSRTWNYNSSGTKETHETQTKYADLTFDEMLTYNILNLTGRVTSTVQVDGDAQPTTIRDVAIQYSPFNGVTDYMRAYIPVGSYQARGASAGEFSAKTGPATSANWIRTHMVPNDAVVTTNGLITRFIDVDQVVHSVLYDKSYRRVVASFAHANAHTGEAGYIGFEDYEDTSFWQYTQPFGDSGALTASEVIKISPNKFSPRQGALAYSMGAWVFTPNKQSCTLTMGGQTIKSDPSRTDWQYLQMTVKITNKPEDAPQVQCDPRSVVDDVWFAPADSLFSASVYDPFSMLSVASISNNGQPVNTFYNLKFESFAHLGPQGEILGFSTEGHSICDTIQNGTCASPGQTSFDASSPNMSVNILSLGGGEYYYLRDSHDPWSFLGSRRNEPIIPMDSGARSFPLNSYQSGYAIRLQIMAPQNFQMNLPDVSITFTQSTGTYTLAQAGKTLKTVKSNAATDWIVVRKGTQVTFWADGRLLLSDAQMAQPVSGNLGIVKPGGGNTNVVNIAVAYDPLVTVSWHDGHGAIVQAQHFNADATGVVTASTLYNGWGTPTINTLPAEALQTGLGFDDSFAGFDWKSGIMSGTVANYYQNGAGKVRVEGQDFQFPYTRHYSENSPLRRIVISTLPGADFSGSDNPYRLVTGYQANTVSGNLLTAINKTLKSQNYTARTGSSPFSATSRVSHVSLSDLDGDPIGTRLLDGSGKALTTTTFSHLYHRSSSAPFFGGFQSTLFQPNYHAGGSQASSFQEMMDHDFLARLRTKTSPDYGVTAKQSSSEKGKSYQYIYDDAGRIRFILDPDGAGAGSNGLDRVIYRTYDPLGRPLEQGTFDYNWNNTTNPLTGQANTPTFPDSSTVLHSKMIYDSGITGDNSSQIDSSLNRGQLIQVSTWNAPQDSSATSTIATETFDHDDRGRVISTTLNVGGKLFTTGYAYNNVDAISSITYPQTSNPLQVTYHYDAAGRIASIGNPNQIDAYARYQYNEDSSIKTESRAGNTLTRNFTYNFRGQLLSLKDTVSGQNGATPLFQETLSYKDSSGKYADGHIQTAEYTGTSVLKPHAWRYQYDELGRLTSAVTQAGNGYPAYSGWNIGSFDKPGIQYDPNGNIQSFTLGSDSQVYAYFPGTNTLRTVTQDQTSIQYSYDANGAVIQSGSDLSLKYNPVSSLPTFAGNGNTSQTSLLYSGSRRVKKSVTTGQNKQAMTYVHGLSEYPLLEQDDTGEQTLYIHGPTGKLAQQSSSGNTHFITDHLGSTRAMVDDTGKPMAQFAYMPFGSLIETASSSESSVIQKFPYRYTSQEYDFDTGIYNYRARLYDQKTRRFLSHDPLQEFHTPYSYVGGNPVNYVDPTGMEGEKDDNPKPKKQDSTILGNNLKKEEVTRKPGQEAHHLIPVAVAKKADIPEEEYNSAINGILLNSGRRQAGEETVGVNHIGKGGFSHPNYNKAISEFLKDRNPEEAAEVIRLAMFQSISRVGTVDEITEEILKEIESKKFFSQLFAMKSGYNLSNPSFSLKKSKTEYTSPVPELFQHSALTTPYDYNFSNALFTTSKMVQTTSIGNMVLRVMSKNLSTLPVPVQRKTTALTRIGSYFLFP